jgi:hypothetical protein
VIANNVCELNRAFNLMYVYCDVGDTKAPLLRVCCINGKHGEMIRTIFTHPHYVPVGRKEFDSIEILLSTELGKPMPFLF